VTSQVHQAGGKIVAQLWHSGRVGHSSVREGQLPVAPSEIPIRGQQHYTPTGVRPYEVPHALSIAEIEATVADYRSAAAAALLAGFDGVELHAAFGYLPNQFLVDGANLRNDAYGGSIAHRCRFTLDVMDALIEVWGAERVGIKLSPLSTYNDVADSDPLSLYVHLLAALGARKVGYVHLMNAAPPASKAAHWPGDVLDALGGVSGRPVIANGGYAANLAESDINLGRAQLVSFGKPFIANPDLPARLALGAPLVEPHRESMYGGSERGYTDYPALGSTTVPQ